MRNEQLISASAKEAIDSMNDLDVEAISALIGAMSSGVTLKDVHGIPDEVMEGIYAHAYEFYQQGRLKDAEVCFRFLCLYDMRNADYMMGLGATFQQQRHYQKAVEAYGLTFSLNEDDCRPLLHAGQCHLLLKQPDQARGCFTTLLESSAAPATLKAQAQAYLSAIKTH